MRLAAPVVSDGLRKSTRLRFGGFNALGTEGEICAMKNLTSDFYPELASRPKRKQTGTVTTPRGIAGGSELIWIDGRDLHYGSSTVTELLEASTAQREIAVIGDLVTIWPDGKWYDTVTGFAGSLEFSRTMEHGAWFSSETSPEGKSSEHNCLTLDGPLEDVVHPGDALTISGCTKVKKNNQTVIVREVFVDKLYFYDDTFGTETVLVCASSSAHAAGTYNLDLAELPAKYDVTLPAVGAGAKLEIYLDGLRAEEDVKLYVTENDVTTGYALTEGTTGTDLGETFETEERDCHETGAITVKREVPELQYVFEHGNRLWGCDGITIRASKLGDPYNWNVFDGTADDSWTVDTGSGGAFTGAISYAGYPRFFKEERIYTLFGDTPAEFQLMEHNFLGVNAGSSRSLTAVNGLLFYLSKVGPCIFQGGAPTRISNAFGIESYKNGVGGTDGKKYYISMQDSANAWHLFVYDVTNGLWIREDDLHALGMAPYDAELYCLTEAGKIVMLGRPVRVPTGAADEDEIAWEAEFGDITGTFPSGRYSGSSPNRKRITKVQLRLVLEEKTRAEVLVQYDSDGEWRKISDFAAAKKKSVVLPVIPRRPDHFRLKIRGTGAVRISSLSIETAAGSDRG